MDNKRVRSYRLFLSIPIFRLAIALSLTAVFLVLLNACEKDDICVEGDTPLLVITFFDAEDPETAKEANRLRIIGLGQGDPITPSDRQTRDSIAIPLRPDATRTGFVFILNSESDDDGNETGNRDTLYFDYSTDELYISRACGFVSQYDGLSDELTPDSENWILDVEVVQTSVTSSVSAHVNIQH